MHKLPFAGATLALAALVQPAAAQAAPPAGGVIEDVVVGPDVAFVCRGRDANVDNTLAMARRMKRSGKMPRMGGKVGMPRRDRVNAKMEVTVAGQKVSVRPSAGAAPMMGASGNGWYVLEQVHVTEDEISGRAPYGVLYNPELSIDRASGATRYGTFEGKCKPVTQVAEAGDGSS